MQDLDIRYVFLILPLIYVMLPYIMLGLFLYLGVLGVVSLILAMVTIVIIGSINISGGAATINFGGGLNSEGTYGLFVVLLGGIFYGVGAGFNYFLQFIQWFSNILHFVFGNVIPTITNSQLAQITFYDYSLKVFNISVFQVLDVGFGLMFAIGLYFLYASRGH